MKKVWEPEAISYDQITEIAEGLIAEYAAESRFGGDPKGREWAFGAYLLWLSITRVTGSEVDDHARLKIILGDRDKL